MRTTEELKKLLDRAQVVNIGTDARPRYRLPQERRG